MVVYANPVNESNARGLLSKRQNTSPFPQVGLYTNLNTSGNTATGKFTIYFSDGANDCTFGTSGTPVNGAWHQYAGVAQTVTQAGAVYLDGLPQSQTSAISGTVSYTGTDPLQVGGINGTTGANCSIAYAYYWLRALSAREILWLYEEPFAFLQQPQRSTFVLLTRSNTLADVDAAGMADAGALAGVLPGADAGSFGDRPSLALADVDAAAHAAAHSVAGATAAADGAAAADSPALAGAAVGADTAGTVDVGAYNDSGFPISDADAFFLAESAAVVCAAAAGDGAAYAGAHALAGALGAADVTAGAEEAGVAFADEDAGRYDSSTDLGVGADEASSADGLVAEVGSLTGEVADTLAVQHQVAHGLVDAFADAVAVAARDAGTVGLGDADSAGHSLSGVFGIGDGEAPHLTLAPALAGGLAVADAGRAGDAGGLAGALRAGEAAGAGEGFVSVPGSPPVFTSDSFRLVEGWALASALAGRDSAALREVVPALAGAAVAMVSVAADGWVRLAGAGVADDAAGASDAIPPVDEGINPIRAGEAFGFVEGAVFLACAAAAGERFAAGGGVALAGVAGAGESGHAAEAGGVAGAVRDAAGVGVGERVGVGLGDKQSAAAGEGPAELAGVIVAADAVRGGDVLENVVAVIHGFEIAVIGDVRTGFAYVVPHGGRLKFCSATVRPLAFCSPSVRPLAYCAA